MRCRTVQNGVVAIGVFLLLVVMAIADGLAQTSRGGLDPAAAQYVEQLQKVTSDPQAAAAEIVWRWEDAARAIGRWDQRFAEDLYNALLTLQPDNLLAAYRATSFEDLMSVLATGQPAPTIAQETIDATLEPNALGDTNADLVFTPVAPCRIVDTRVAGGFMAANTSRLFDVDGSDFSPQGGYAGSCGLPFGVPRAVAMSIAAVSASGFGWVTAWSYGAPRPNASTLNYLAGWTVASTAIVPVVPGSGGDFNLGVYGSGTHVVVDVVGYYAAPVATALDCTTAMSATIAAPVNVWTPVDVACPAGRTATGGGWDTTEGTLGYPNVWLTSLPNGNGWRTWVDNQASGPRSIRTYVRCCRVPGR